MASDAVNFTQILSGGSWNCQIPKIQSTHVVKKTNSRSRTRANTSLDLVPRLRQAALFAPSRNRKPSFESLQHILMAMFPARAEWLPLQFVSCAIQNKKILNGDRQSWLKPDPADSVRHRQTASCSCPRIYGAPQLLINELSREFRGCREDNSFFVAFSK